MWHLQLKINPKKPIVNMRIPCNVTKKKKRLLRNNNNNYATCHILCKTQSKQKLVPKQIEFRCNTIQLYQTSDDSKHNSFAKLTTMQTQNTNKVHATMCTNTTCIKPPKTYNNVKLVCFRISNHQE